MLSRLEEMFRNGRLPDPRTTRGLIIYTVLGIGIGWFLATL
jgi:hypothetical protein